MFLQHIIAPTNRCVVFVGSDGSESVKAILSFSRPSHILSTNTRKRLAGLTALRAGFAQSCVSVSREVETRTSGQDPGLSRRNVITANDIDETTNGFKPCIGPKRGTDE
jgi:hypothetical protein